MAGVTGPRSAIALALVLGAAMSLLAAPARAEEPADACSAPPSVMTLGAPLKHTGDRLQRGLPLKIVALGSSSTAGVGASDAAHAYPSQLAAELERRFPKSTVTVLNKGINGEQTKDMLARFERDVLDEHPDLVIWQTGSNEILRKGSPDAFRERVLDGLERLHAANIETILMDAQYAPPILANPEHPVFNGLLRKLARAAKVALLDRFEAMRYWFAKGRANAPAMLGKDDVHMTDAGYHCVGKLLASLIVAELPQIAAR